MRVSVPVVATAAFLLSASTAASAADYTGFWQWACTDPYGVSIKPAHDDVYLISFCGPGGCSRWKPNTTIDGDPLYQVIDANTLDVRTSPTEPWKRLTKCTTETNPKLEWPKSEARLQPVPVPQAQANPGHAGGGERLNRLWLGTWKSQDGTATVKLSATRLVHTYQEKAPDGRPFSTTVELDWSPSSTGGDPGHFGYSAERASPEKILAGYEETVRQFKEDPEFVISDPATSRQAIAAISPGTYRVLWSYDKGDCGGWEYILDKDRMLEWTECKYVFYVTLYNRVK